MIKTIKTTHNKQKNGGKQMKKLTAIVLSMTMCMTTSTTAYAEVTTKASDRVVIGTNTYTLNTHSTDYTCLAGEGYHLSTPYKHNASPNSKVTPSEVPETIEGYPVICLHQSFASISKDGYYGSVISAPVVPKFVKDMSYAYKWSQIKTPPIIPDNVTTLELAFYGSRQMTSFPQIGNSVETMESTFQDCSSARGNVTVPSSVQNMRNTFVGCGLLSEIVDISHLDNLKEATYTFSGCRTAIGGTDIPDSGLKSITGMFQGCIKMTTPPSVIHESVTDISLLFEDCNNLSGTIDVRGAIKDGYYNDAFKATATAPGCELILNYTTANEHVIDDIIATKLITSNIKKGVLLPNITPPEPTPDPDTGESDGTPPVVPDIDTAGDLPLADGTGHQEIMIEGIVEPINTIDIDVPLKLQFVIDEERNIHYTTNAKVISRSPAPLNVYSASVNTPPNAPELVANDAFADWNNLNVLESMNNIAISINDQNLLMKKIKLGGIDSAYERRILISIENIPSSRHKSAD